MVWTTLMLVACIDSYDEETDPPVPSTVTIGSEGGEIETGGAIMIIPEGALEEPIEIRFYETEDDPPGEYEALSKVWAAEPHGLVFASPITVEIPFAPEDSTRPRMFWSNDDGGYDQLVTTLLEPGRVTASVDHFSTAFVAQLNAEIVEEPNPFPPADVLFIVDNSCSMSEEQQAIFEAVAAIIPTLQVTGIDYHLGVVSTDMDDQANHAGKLQIGGGVNFLEPTTPDQEAAFQQMATLGTSGAFEEKGRAAAYTMVEVKPDIPRNAGFYRDEATLSFIFLSDEEDQSGSNPVSRPDFRQWMETKKGRPEDVVAHAIIAPPGQPCPGADTPGEEYARYADWTGGVIGNLCEDDWQPFVDQMFDQLLDTGRVAIPGAAEVQTVTLSGPSGDRDLAPAEYTVDLTTELVYLDQGVRPEDGDTVIVTYEPL